LSYLTVFGAGSLLTALVQILLNTRAKNRQRQYDERKEAYVGLLEAWVRQEDDGYSDASMRDVGHWVLRSELVASTAVFELLKKWQDTKPGSDERIETTKRLKLAMRDDLRSI
jgi:hypothetical protein